MCTINELKDNYKEVTSGLIEFLRQVHSKGGQYSIKTRDLDALFSPALWEQFHKGGHKKLKNKITKIVVEYPHHDKDIKAGVALGVAKAVQLHINILGNEIFRYTTRNWKTEPNFTAAVVRARGYR